MTIPNAPIKMEIPAISAIKIWTPLKILLTVDSVASGVEISKSSSPILTSLVFLSSFAISSFVLSNSFYLLVEPQ